MSGLPGERPGREEQGINPILTSVTAEADRADEAVKLIRLRDALVRLRVRAELRDNTTALLVYPPLPRHGLPVWVFVGYGGAYYSWQAAEKRHPVADVDGPLRRWRTTSAARAGAAGWLGLPGGGRAIAPAPRRAAPWPPADDPGRCFPPLCLLGPICQGPFHVPHGRARQRERSAPVR